MEIRIKDFEVKITKQRLMYTACCHNMERVVHGESYAIHGLSDWDDIRRSIKDEIDKGEHSIIKFCPYCGKKIEWIKVI